MRYIDADTLCKRLDDYTSYDDNWDIEDLSSDLVFITIKEQPTADVKEVVHAEWKNNSEDYPECTNCGYMPMFDPHIDDIYYSPFCPYCGATMDLKAGANND